MIEAKEEFFAAFTAAQKAFKEVKKTKTARIVSQKGSYVYHYADLADILPAVVPALNDNNICFSQPVVIVYSEDGTANTVLKTQLVHGATGQGIESEWPLPAQADPKATGALLSYYRRYAAQSMLGIAADEEEEKTEDEANPDGSRPVVRKVKRHSGAIPNASKYTQTELKAWIKEFVREIEACSDQDQLDALIASQDTMIGEIQKNLSAWWYGDHRNPDYEPVPSVIARKSREFAGDV